MSKEPRKELNKQQLISELNAIAIGYGASKEWVEAIHRLIENRITDEELFEIKIKEKS